MNDNLPTSAVLNLAADAMERDGWTVGNGGMCLVGPRCTMGAIGSALGVEATWTYDGRPAMDYGPVEDSPATQALLAYLGDRVPLSLGQPQLWAWNDRPERTADQVIATLRAAALVEAARETPADLDVFDAATLAEVSAVAELVSR